MMKNLLLLVTIFVTSISFAQTASLISPPTTTAQGKTLALSGNYDVGTGHTVEGTGVSFILREYNTNDNTFIWKADAKDATSIGSNSGTTSADLVIPSDITLSENLASGFEYRIFMSFKDETDSFTSTYQTITITKGYIFDFEDVDSFTALNSGTKVTVTEGVTKANATNSLNKVVQIDEAIGAASWQRMFMNGFTGFNLNNGAGQYFSLKFISPKAAGTITLKLANSVNYQITESYSGVTPGEWSSIEFHAPYFGTDTGLWINRIDIGFDMDASANNTVAETYYIDDIERNTNSTLGVKNYNLKKIGVYPNPTSDFISIENASKDIKSVKIYDVTGKEVKNFNKHTNMDVSNLAKGIYLLKTDNGRLSKFIKK